MGGMNQSDDLIVELLRNRANWKKLTLEMANTELYQLSPWDIDCYLKENWRWN